MSEHFLKGELNQESGDAPPAPRVKNEDGIGELLKIFVSAVAIAFLVRSLAFEPFTIPSGSMEPTLLIGDTLFVSKYPYGYGPYSVPFIHLPFEGRIAGGLPKRGDIVVFKLPTDTNVDYIKRVIGLPGDAIRVTDGRLFINDKMVERQFKGDVIEFRDGIKLTHKLYLETLPNGVEHAILEDSDHAPLDNTRTFSVPAGHYFMMGDNRDGSQDSRVFNKVGYVPFDNIVGRAERIFYSIKDDGPWWEFWRWGETMRGDRLFRSVDDPVDGLE